MKNPNNNQSHNTIFCDRKVRTEVARNSHIWFFNLYFPHYIKQKIAKFHKEIFQFTENLPDGILAIMAFRNSGKSTLITLSHAIWSVVGKHEKKYVIIFARTQDQAKQHLYNIKQELESNKSLINDFGPFEIGNEEWTAYSLILPKYKARIVAWSMEQGIRGARFIEYRPDLIILDDVEDNASVKTKEGRDKTYDCLTREIIPLGDKGTKIIIVGNLLHADSLMMRLRREIIDDKTRTGIFKSYPLLDDAGNIAWPDKYRNIDEIEQLRMKVGSDIAWKQEYLLTIVYDYNRIIKPEQLHYYDSLPKGNGSFMYNIISVDPAVSESDQADYTAIVPMKVYGNKKNLKIYILPQIINKRMDFNNSIAVLSNLYKILSASEVTKVFIEGIGFQTNIVESLKNFGIPAEAASIQGDKRSRLTATAGHIANGAILFPRSGAEQLIEQITDFGCHGHDDLADAFSLGCNRIIREDNLTTFPDLIIISGS